MRSKERFLGAIEIASSLPNATELGQRPAELAGQIRTELLSRTESLLLRHRARSTESQNVGAVNATATMQTTDGTHASPAFHRLRPLLGEVVLRERLQSADDLTVDNSRRHRIDLT